jgi:hypothetical protein
MKRMQKRTRILKLWLPVLVWAGVIFSFSSMSINKETAFSWLDFVVKKTAHVVEYFILYWLLFRAISEKNEKINKKVFVWSIVIAIFYALSDEWHQTFVPGREGTLRDVGFDTIGVLLSTTLIKRNL